MVVLGFFIGIGGRVGGCESFGGFVGLAGIGVYCFVVGR